MDRLNDFLHRALFFSMINLLICLFTILVLGLLGIIR